MLEVINQVKHPKLQLLLTLRYIERLNWDVIEEKIELPQNTRNKLHAQALAAIRIPNNR